MLKYERRSSKTENHTNVCVLFQNAHNTAQDSQGSVTQQLQEAIGTGSILKIWFRMQSAWWSALKFPLISFHPRKYNNIDS